MFRAAYFNSENLLSSTTTAELFDTTSHFVLDWPRSVLLRDAIWWHETKSHDAFGRQLHQMYVRVLLYYTESGVIFVFPKNCFLCKGNYIKKKKNVVLFNSSCREHFTCTRLYELVRQRIAGHDVECIEIAIPENLMHFHTRHGCTFSVHRRSTLASSSILCHTAQFFYVGFS